MCGVGVQVMEADLAGCAHDTLQGTWLYVSPKMEIIDKNWIATSDKLLKEMLNSDKSEFSKIGKTADYKEHDKLVRDRSPLGGLLLRSSCAFGVLTVFKR